MVPVDDGDTLLAAHFISHDPPSLSQLAEMIPNHARPPASAEGPNGGADLDPDFWAFGITLFSFGAVSPWLSLVDEAKYGAHVDRVQSLDIKTVACCHSPVLEGQLIDRAFEITRRFPTLPAPDLPNQSVLDQIIAATAQPPDSPPV